MMNLPEMALLIQKLLPDSMNSKIEFDDKSNTLNLLIKADVQIGVEGDFSIATKNGMISVDSIGSVIHLNSRLSKALRDLPESIEYRRQKKEEWKKAERCRIEYTETLRTLKERVSLIEEQLKGRY